MRTLLCTVGLSGLVLWLAFVECRAAPVEPMALDGAVARLARPGTTLKQVTDLLGEPEQYVWGRRSFAREKLPDPVILRYTNGLDVVVSGGHVDELRCHAGGEGFSWKGSLRLGSSIEEVLAVVGPPEQTIEGREVNYGRGVLYKDINRKPGYCYYQPKNDPVRFFFEDYNVTAIYVGVNEPEHRTLMPVAMPRYVTNLSPAGAVTIVRHPPPADFRRGVLPALPAYDPRRAGTPWLVDLRGYDAGALNLTSRLSDLLHASFDTKTRWPAQLPAGFEPVRIMELGKDPGLGVRELHRQGITGKGVGIGIIDQTLLVAHAEYRDRLRSYEEIHNPDTEAQMHGPAVASVALGKTVGVAPEADLYYIAETHGVVAGGAFEWDFTYLAASIDRLLEINTGLPHEKRIRVISVSVGWSPQQKDYQEVMDAVERAEKAGVFVISTALERTAGLSFHGLGRESVADPNSYSSYGPGAFWAKAFRDGTHRFGPGERLLAPMDARCLASPTGDEDFVYYSEGGWSWAVPWIAGLYALACQVKPDITPKVFWHEALKTGTTIPLLIEDREVPFGTIANPAALIRSLKP